ncbi:DEAD/DEAH box helicase [Ahrensia marina]|uniref:DEAD/DEAH box helicase n=1 Tax=Ahrensia marina TaxID=1514904 RepID=A0A0N0E8M3_9HYPH|nr:DEAD/DEAH box helicase [Ahrensia marina]KPB02512.1 DEAD/DEAH box helicase [Ahrensia marina]
MSKFEGVSPALVTALSDRGYETLTQVQSDILNPDFREKDLLVSAQTGSGKTVAFGIAIAPTLLGGDEKFLFAAEPYALVVAPTRELALQVKRELEWLYKDANAVICSCVGGMDMRDERRALSRGANIVVGTPGRLRDHIMRKSLDLSQMRAVVLDEADEMLDLGFKEDLEFILDEMPTERRTLMFSATVPAMIAKLAKSYQRDAVRVEAKGEDKQHGDIEYRALSVSTREKENAIINVLRYYEAKNAIVFCNTRASVNHLVARFNNRGFSVVALSGELSQNERTHALQAMRDGRARVCIATDVAARGIDLPGLDLVVHAELPSNPETLLHRSGRTGRAGNKGVSVLMIDPRGRKKAERILRFAKVEAIWANPPSADEVLARDEERLMADPVLNDPIAAEERDFIDRLMDQFSPEQLTAAFIRTIKTNKSAPEDIEQIPFDAPRERGERSSREPRPARDEFENVQWVSLSVGRRQNAEPRWLIPLLCNAGGITKRQIGQIKMQNEETFVQLDGDHAEKFFMSLGPNNTLEKNIIVKALDGTPTFKQETFLKPEERERAPKPAKKGFGARKPRGERQSQKFDKSTGSKASTTKRGSKPAGDPPNKEGWAKKKPKGAKTKKNKSNAGRSKPKF